MIALAVPTFHQFSPFWRASAGNVKSEFVDGDAVCDCQVVDALVWSFSGQKLPQHHAVAEKEDNIR